MQNAENEAKSETNRRDRGIVSANGYRLVSEIQSWLLRRVGDVHVARNKPAGGCWWTNGGDKVRRTGKKRRKIEKRRKDRHAPNCSVTISGFSFTEIFFCGALNNDILRR